MGRLSVGEFGRGYGSGRSEALECQQDLLLFPDVYNQNVVQADSKSTQCKYSGPL